MGVRTRNEITMQCKSCIIRDLDTKESEFFVSFTVFEGDNHMFLILSEIIQKYSTAEEMRINDDKL